MVARAWAKWGVALAVALAGCGPQAALGPNKPRDRANGVANTAPVASPDAKGSDATNPNLPLPSTSQAPLVLSGFRGQVLQPDGKPAVGVSVRATLITDNGSGLLGNNAAGLVGAGGGLLGNNAAGLVGAGGGSLLGNNASSYQLLASGMHPMVRRLLQEGISATTNAEGRYNLELPATGAYNLETANTDASLKAIALAATKASDTVNLNLATPGKLSIGVKSALGPVADFTGVQIFIPGTSYNGVAGTTGVVVLDGVPPGNFPVIAMSSRLGQGILREVPVLSGKLNEETRKIVLERPPVKLVAINPPVFVAGQKVSLVGEQFGKSTESLFDVQLAGKSITAPVRESNTLITFTAPANAESGDVVVSVDGFKTNALQAHVATNLEVVAPRQLEAGTTRSLQVAALTGRSERVRSAPFEFKVSGAAGVADVNASGVVSAVAAGSTELTVSLGSLSVKLPVSVVAQGVLSGKPGQAHALVANLMGMAVDSARQRIVLSNPNNLIAYPMAGGAPTLLAGPATSASSGSGSAADGSASTATFADLAAVSVHPDGSVVAVDSGTVLRKLSLAGIVSSLAGNPDGGDSFKEGLGVGATFDYLEHVAALPEGKVVVSSFDTLASVSALGQVAKVVTTPAFPKDAYTQALEGRSDGTCLSLTDEGLFRLNTNGSLSQLADGSSQNWGGGFLFSSGLRVATAPDGQIWVVNAEGKLLRGTGGSDTWQRVLPAGPEEEESVDGALGTGKPGRLGLVQAMAFDADARLWLLTGGKLCRIDTPLVNPTLQTLLRPGLPLATYLAIKKTNPEDPQ